MALPDGSGCTGMVDQGHQHERVAPGHLGEQFADPGRHLGPQHLFAELMDLGTAERRQIELRDNAVIPQGQELLRNQRPGTAGSEQPRRAGGDGLRDQLDGPLVQVVGVVDHEQGEDRLGPQAGRHGPHDGRVGVEIVGGKACQVRCKCPERDGGERRSRCQPDQRSLRAQLRQDGFDDGGLTGSRVPDYQGTGPSLVPKAADHVLNDTGPANQGRCISQAFHSGPLPPSLTAGRRPAEAPGGSTEARAGRRSRDDIFELRSAGDMEFRVHLVQVALHRADRDVHLFGNLAV